VQGERNIADRVREIDPDGDAAALGVGGDRLEIEQLAGEKVHPGQHYHCDLLTFFL